MAEQCLSTARIGPHQCGHRTRAVLSSDKHWQAVLEHCLALLGSYDTSTAVSAVTGRSLGHCTGLLSSTALWPSHCFHELLLPNVDNPGAVLKALLASALIHCFKQSRISSVNSGWAILSLLGIPWQQRFWSKPGTRRWLLKITQKPISGGWYFCLQLHTSKLNICKLIFEVEIG